MMDCRIPIIRTTCAQPNKPYTHPRSRYTLRGLTMKGVNEHEPIRRPTAGNAQTQDQSHSALDPVDSDLWHLGIRLDSLRAVERNRKRQARPTDQQAVGDKGVGHD